MNTHEYQAKSLLQKFGIPTPPFIIASTEEEIVEGVLELGLKEGVAKVQIHAGGRGKAGGVRIAHNSEELVRIANGMLGMEIRNRQTGSAGVICRQVLLTPLVSIVKEYYLAVIIDRSAASPMLLASPEGGMEIEEIALQKPEQLIKVPIQRDGSMRSYHVLELAKFMGWEGDVAVQGRALAKNLAQAFIASDAALLEINPLVLTPEKRLVALDAKLSIDDNALYRQQAIASWDDPHQHSEGEQLAKRYGLAYIGLEGTIGCLVNGAGLAMATMDIIQYYGGQPANFLDVGGGATQEQVAQAFGIIMLDPRVRVIFVNIFGGIMDCEVLAQGIIAAVREEGLQVPLIVRLEGTNMELGKQALAASALKIISVESMAEGAQEAVKWQS